MEELLRETACVGNLHGVQKLLQSGTNINSQNSVNGWTALHWVCRRGHTSIARLLIQSGADVNLRTHNGELPVDVATTSDIIQLLCGSEEPIPRTVTPIEEKLPIVPNYLQNPPFPYYEVDPDKAFRVPNSSQCRASSECHGHSQDTKLVAKMEALAVAHSECGSSVSTFEKLPNKEINDQEANSPSSFSSSPFLVKVCVGGSGDSDFVEVEVPSMTYPVLLMACCEELDIPTSDVVKIRKLPNVWVRKDRDVQRMREGQELEIILKGDGANGCDGGGVKTDSPR